MKYLTRLSFTVCASLALFGCTAQTPTDAVTTPQDIITKQDTGTKTEHASHPVLAKLKLASGDQATLDTILEKLIGSWHSAAENYDEEDLAWMKENGISDFYDTFTWGTNKAWIDFGDYRVKDGNAEKTGVGMISWHTGFQHMRFRESGARGGLVDGMIEIKDEHTFIRHYEFFTPKGEVKYRSDSWTFDPTNLNCFIWQTTTYKGNEPTTYPGRKYCKK